MGQAAAVNVEGFEDTNHAAYVEAPFMGPQDHVEVFLAGFQAIENSIEKEGVVAEFVLQEAEVVVVEFEPEALSL